MPRRSQRQPNREHYMSSPTRSLFRPRGGVDQSILHEHWKLIDEIDRRKLLRGTLSLGALSLLSGCSVTDTPAIGSFMSAISAFNDGVQQLIFRPNHLAPTYREDQVVK